jgi:hypothetical protein
MQLSKIRGAANGKVETSRGRKEYMGSHAGVPKIIIQDGKKGI